MKYLLMLCILINFIALITFSAGCYMILSKDILPKVRANITSIVAIFFFLYCFILILTAVYGAYVGQYKYLSLLFFAFIPFVFGYCVKFNTIKVYVILHILMMMLSLVFLF